MAWLTHVRYHLRLLALSGASPGQIHRTNLDRFLERLGSLTFWRKEREREREREQRERRERAEREREEGRTEREEKHLHTETKRDTHIEKTQPDPPRESGLFRVITV